MTSMPQEQIEHGGRALELLDDARQQGLGMGSEFTQREAQVHATLAGAVMDTLFRVWSYTLGIFWLAIIALAVIVAVVCIVIAPVCKWLIDRFARVERYEPADLGEAPAPVNHGPGLDPACDHCRLQLAREQAWTAEDDWWFRKLLEGRS